MDMTRQTTEEKFDVANKYREKYLQLRAAMIEVIGVEDEMGELVGMLGELTKIEECDPAILGMVVALIETKKD